MTDPSQAGGPRWLALAQRLQAMAQTGLAFAADHYNQERYTAIRDVAFEMMAAGFGAGRSEVAAAFASEGGYATPKVDVRAAVFRDKILLVRERADGLWSLPGGWLDVGESPREAAAREVREESGYAVATGRLLAVLDKASIRIRLKPSWCSSCSSSVRSSTMGRFPQMGSRFPSLASSARVRCLRYRSTACCPNKST